MKLLITIAILSILISTQSFACSCVTYVSRDDAFITYDNVAVVELVDIYYENEVTEVYTYTPSTGEQSKVDEIIKKQFATANMVRVLKGQPSFTITIAGGMANGGMCYTPLEILKNKRLIVFFDSTNVASVSECEPSGILDENELQKYLGKEP